MVKQIVVVGVYNKWLYVFFQGGHPGSMGPPSVAPSFRPEDELEHLTKKMLYDMENPPSDEYFGEWDSEQNS